MPRDKYAFTQEFWDNLLEPYVNLLREFERRLERCERRLDDADEYDFGDLPTRSVLVQRAARECGHPVATQTNVRGRFMREGMAVMFAWMADRPGVRRAIEDEYAKVAEEG